jgi:hypothetical protein
MTDYNQLQVGGLVLPLTTSGGNSLLQDADPALFQALSFWSWVIDNYVGARLVTAMSLANLKWPNASIMSAVAQRYPWDPIAAKGENQFQFPLFAAYRKRIDTEWITAAWEHEATTLEILYVLPPLDAAQAEQIVPIFTAIEKALRKKTSDGWDPGYTPPGGSLGQQWTALANVEEAGIGEYRGFKTRAGGQVHAGDHGKLEWGGDLYFPCLRLNAYIVERDMYNPDIGGPQKFAGGDINLGLQASDGTSIPNVVQVSTQGAPTITSLSVPSGPVAGGTSTTLTGTLFLAGCAVYFGPPSGALYAPSVTFNSSTSVTVTTPAVQGVGTVDTTIVNRDGQAFTLPASFSFV